jgi:hypothetical protein
MKVFLVWFCVFGVFAGALGMFMTSMPGVSHRGALPPLTEDERDVMSRLQAHVDVIGHEIGVRGPHVPLAAAQVENYLSSTLRRSGFDVKTLDVDAKSGMMHTLECQVFGSRFADEIVVVAAHFDSNQRSPGADANASGVAVLLEVARMLQDQPSERTVRFLLFPTGAGTYAGNETSAAAKYARAARQRSDKIVAMLSLDCLGTFNDKPGGQGCPFPVSICYPDTGNFVAFAGDFGSRDAVRKCVELFRGSTKFPCEGGVFPGFTPGFACSDDACFRRENFPALVVTDTGTMRNEKCGTSFDTYDRLDYDKMARVTLGLVRVVNGLMRKASLT